MGMFDYVTCPPELLPDGFVPDDWMDDYREGCKYCPCQKFTEPGRDK